MSARPSAPHLSVRRPLGRRHTRAAQLRMVVTALVSLALVATALVGTAGSASAAKKPLGAGPGPGNTFAFATRVMTTLQPRSAGPAVTIGSVTYGAPHLAASCAAGVWVLRLGRQDLDLKSSLTYPICTSTDASQLQTKLKAIGGNQLVVVNSINSGQKPVTVPGLGDALKVIGATSAAFSAVDLGSRTFSVVGVSGMSPGQAYTSFGTVAEEAGLAVGAHSRASVDGRLAPDNNANYAPTMLDYALYTIAPNGDMTLNADAYPVPARPAGFLGGFHVLVLDRRTLSKISDTLYSTTGNLPEQYRMQTDLDRIATERVDSAVLLVATVGTPMNGTVLPAAPGGPTAGCVRTPFRETCPFSSTGAEQTFTVPQPAFAGTTSTLHVVLQGGKGGNTEDGPTGGRGAQVTADVPFGSAVAVKPGTTLYAVVGGNGQDGGHFDAGAGGFNGGGDGADNSSVSSWPSAGGGGASDLRTQPMSASSTLSSRLVVAAGGGGAGGNPAGIGQGGNGGDFGQRGANGSAQGSRAPAVGGGPGTATAGGSAGGSAAPGVLGDGGLGAQNDSKRTGSGQFSWGAGGGGGGGLYGGGGGGRGQVPGNLGGAGGGGGSNLLAGGTAAAGSAQPTVTISYPTLYGPTMGQSLGRFGATPSLIDNLAQSPRYAMVGSANPVADRSVPNPFAAPEASPSILAGATGQLQGVLGRGKQNMYYGPLTSNAPVVKVLNGQPQPPTEVNYGLYDVIAHKTAPWPVPAGEPGSPTYVKQSAALAAISQAACGCSDIRQQYNVASPTLGQWKSNIKAQTYSSNPTYDQAAFTAVQAQLFIELGDVVVVNGLKAGMRSLMTYTNQTLGPTLKQTYQTIKASLNLGSGSDGAVVEAITTFILTILGIVMAAVPGASAALGAVSAVLSLTWGVTNAPNGDNQLDTTVGQLATQVLDMFEQGLSVVDLTFDYVYADWGKLAAVTEGMTKQAEQWDVTTANAGQVVTTMSNSFDLGFYRAMVPVAYQYAEARADDGSHLGDYCWEEPNGDDPPTFTCAPVNASALYHAMSQLAYNGYQARYDTITVWTGNETNPNPIPDSLVTQMQGVGLFPPDMFLRWDFPARSCLHNDWDEGVWSTEFCDN